MNGGAFANGHHFCFSYSAGEENGVRSIEEIPIVPCYS